MRQEMLVDRRWGTVPNNGSLRIETGSETRIETTVYKEDLSRTVDAIQMLYPNSVVPCDIYPLVSEEAISGTGRIGHIARREKLSDFADYVRRSFHMDFIKVAGDPDLIIERVAVCSGSGSGLINEFLASGAQVYISGDLRYHDARLVEQSNLALIDIGHFSSEFIVVDELAGRLQKMFHSKNLDVDIEACRVEKDPFWLIPVTPGKKNNG
jgi:putative NIF3 family GTP cyclohydrolase 1 type 2